MSQPIKQKVKRSGFCYKFSSFLRDNDNYGHPVTLTYKKFPEFRSPLGGLISLLITLFMLSFFGYLMNQCITRQQVQVLSSTIRSDLNEDPTVLTLNISNFDIAFLPFISSGQNALNATNVDQYLFF